MNSTQTACLKTQDLCAEGMSQDVHIRTTLMLVHFGEYKVQISHTTM